MNNENYSMEKLISKQRARDKEIEDRIKATNKNDAFIRAKILELQKRKGRKKDDK